VRGGFEGLGFHHTRAHLFRAVMESIGNEYNSYKEILEELTSIHINEVIVVGGGAKSNLFNQIKSEILKVPYRPLEITDTGMLGSAMIAAYSVGIINEI
ncbi:MAG: xylulose kinase, partial [Clostridia bacterium]|nr:xylulose kinase [Clostridia bacterium]